MYMRVNISQTFKRKRNKITPYLPEPPQIEWNKNTNANANSNQNKNNKSWLLPSYSCSFWPGFYFNCCGGGSAGRS